ncbi:MAG: beta-hydroxyacyl-ACP dehydratase [Rhodopirellula sp.]|nr:beta-hydroxyacyl-ACP dehydratase [Rhodopirellula sp.]
MRKDSWIVEPRLLDAAHVIADVDAIRQYNPQRFEMEQLTAIIYEDADRHVCVGHKDLTADEFWVRGQGSHPIMPAVLMCEAAGQLANYYALRHRLYAVQGGFVGLKGVRYRRIAKPGERLFVIARLLKIRSTLLTCQFQCAVGRRVVCDGVLIGGGAAWMKD